MLPRSARNGEPDVPSARYDLARVRVDDSQSGLAVPAAALIEQAIAKDQTLGEGPGVVGERLIDPHQELHREVLVQGPGRGCGCGFWVGIGGRRGGGFDNSNIYRFGARCGRRIVRRRRGDARGSRQCQQQSQWGASRHVPPTDRRRLSHSRATRLILPVPPNMRHRCLRRIESERCMLVLPDRCR